MDIKYKGGREGREKGGFLLRIKDVGRKGKGPVSMPSGMLGFWSWSLMKTL